MNLDMPPVFLLSPRPDRTKNPHHRLQATRTTPNDEHSKATVRTQQHGNDPVQSYQINQLGYIDGTDVSLYLLGSFGTGASETQGLAGIALTFVVQVPSQMVA
ncbi:hypothetical protein NL676_038759 [Syzygium grande]|nr:hypothetical protein NL676_038759 [Syzygium grande]